MLMAVRCPECGATVYECACGDHVRAWCSQDGCDATIDLRGAERVVASEDGQATVEDFAGGETA